MNEITITVKSSNTLKTVVRGLRAASKLVELVPDWHARERDEAAKRIRRSLRKLASSLESE